MKKIKVLVTGINSGVGLSIYKSLKISELKLDIYCADIDNKFSLAPIFKKYLNFPKVEKKSSLKKIVDILKKNKIDVLFIGSEFEIEFFAKNSDFIFKKTNTKVCVQPYQTIKIFNNKLSTYNYLKNDVLMPKTVEVKNLIEAKKKGKELKFPFYIKPRIGTSARGIYLINSMKDLEFYFDKVNKPILQKIIPNNNFVEYTCGIFKDKENELIGPFIVKRFLKHGTSWVASRVFSKKLARQILEITKRITFHGSINLQFKLGKNNRIYLLEINPRLSGTTVFRANLGFNEPEMFIKNFILRKKIKFKDQKNKGFLFRHFDEIFLVNKKIFKNKWL